MKPSRSSRLPRRLAVLLASTLLLTTHCGKKPEPQGTPTDATEGSAGPQAPGAKLTKTAGGVTLVGVSPEVAKAANRMARQRNAGVYDLLQIGAKATPVAVALLGSENLEEIEGALEVLRTLRAPAATPTMVALMTHDAAGVRDAARKTLETYPPADLGPALMPVLSHTDDAVRINAIRFLGTIGYTPAGKPLVPLLGHKNPAVALEAATALGRIGDTTHAAAALAMAVDEAATPTQQQAALLAARRLGARVPTEPLSRLLKSETPEVVREAARAIAPISVKDTARTALAESAWSHPIEGVDVALLEGITAAPSAPASEPPPVPAWVKAGLASDQTDVRVAALTLVGATWSGDARTQALVSALPDANLVVRRAAVVLVAKHLAPAEATPLLGKLLLTEADTDTQRVVVFALAGIKTRASLQLLVDQLDHKTLDLPAWVALQGVSETQQAREKALWQTWLDGAYPAPKPATETPVDEGGKPGINKVLPHPEAPEKAEPASPPK